MKRFAIATLALLAISVTLVDSAEAGRRHHRRRQACCGSGANYGGNYQTPVQKGYYQSPVQKHGYDLSNPVPPAPVDAPPAT